MPDFPKPLPAPLACDFHDRRAFLGHLSMLSSSVFLAACGGGGGPSASTVTSETNPPVTPAATPSPNPSPSPSPSPSPAPAPAPAPTVATGFSITGPVAGSNGLPATFRVAPVGGVLAADATVTISAPGATTSVATLTFSAGSTAAKTFTITRSDDGETLVSITNSGGLQNAGSPSSFVTGLPSLPYQVPPPGHVANISLNNYSESCLPESWFTRFPNVSPWKNWSCPVYATNFSAFGAMVYWGGGHNGGNQSDAHVFDFATGKWTRVGPGQPSFDYLQEQNTSASQVDPTWGDFPWNGGHIIPAVHTYSYPVYVPPGFDGAGSKGSWMLPRFVSGQGGGAHVHYMDLATGFMDRGSTNVGTEDAKPGFAGSLFDPVRRKLWWGSAEATNINMMDMSQPQPRTIKVVQVSGGSLAQGESYYPVYLYMVEADRFVEFACPYGKNFVTMQVYDTSSGTVTRSGFVALPTEGAPTMGAGFGVDWCPITGKWYFYNGNGASTVYTLSCSDPANLMTATYAWGSEPFPNAAWQDNFNSGGGALAFNHWRYIPKLRCFIWMIPGYTAVCQDGQTRDGVVQLWRPLAT